METKSTSKRSHAVNSQGRFHALRCALSWPVAKRSAMVMAIVGSTLNIINQGDVIWNDGSVSWWKLVLTYLVPFCVASYGAYCAFCAGGTDRERSFSGQQ